MNLIFLVGDFEKNDYRYCWKQVVVDFDVLMDSESMKHL